MAQEISSNEIIDRLLSGQLLGEREKETYTLFAVPSLSFYGATNRAINFPEPIQPRRNTNANTNAFPIETEKHREKINEKINPATKGNTFTAILNGSGPLRGAGVVNLDAKKSHSPPKAGIEIANPIKVAMISLLKAMIL